MDLNEGLTTDELRRCADLMDQVRRNPHVTDVRLTDATERYLTLTVLTGQAHATSGQAWVGARIIRRDTMTFVDYGTEQSQQ